MQFGFIGDAAGFMTVWARMYSPDGAAFEQRVTDMAHSVCSDDPRTAEERRNAGLRSYGRDPKTRKTEIVGKGTWTPLVDENTWRAAQTVLDAPGRAPGRKSVSKHLLTSVLRCGKPGCDGTLSGRWVMRYDGGHAISYGCKKCRGVAVRATDVEPLLYRLVGGRLAAPDAIDLLRKELHDEAEAEALRIEANALLAQIAAAEAEYDDGIIDGKRLAGRRARAIEKLAEIEARQHDAERLRVFDGIPLGRPEAVAAVQELSPDRFRAVLGVLCDVAVLPVGRGTGRRGFDPDRVRIDWR